MIRVAQALCWAAALALATSAAALAYPKLTVPQSGDPPLDPSAPASGWSQAASLTLSWDPVHSRPASEATTAWISTDGHALYVRFEATQREPIAAAQHTNDVGPGQRRRGLGRSVAERHSGYFYQFHSTPERYALRVLFGEHERTRRTGNRPARRTPTATR